VVDIDLHQILRSAVPQWNRAGFLFLEPEPWRAPSVQSELARSDTRAIQVRFGQKRSEPRFTTDYRCRSLQTTRRILDQIRTDDVSGVVLIVEQQMRDCLLFLGRLNRLCRPSPPVLMIIDPNVESLIPVLMESGASAVMTQVVSDNRIADWCRRVAITRRN